MHVVAEHALGVSLEQVSGVIDSPCLGIESLCMSLSRCASKD